MLVSAFEEGTVATPPIAVSGNEAARVSTLSRFLKELELLSVCPDPPCNAPLTTRLGLQAWSTAAIIARWPEKLLQELKFSVFLPLQDEMGVEEQDEPGGLDKGTTDGRTGTTWG